MKSLKIINRVIFGSIRATYLRFHNDSVSVVMEIESDSMVMRYGYNQMDADDGIANIDRLLRVLNLDFWEELKGCKIKIGINENDCIYGIGNVTNENWFSF